MKIFAFDAEPPLYRAQARATPSLGARVGVEGRNHEGEREATWTRGRGGMKTGRRVEGERKMGQRERERARIETGREGRRKKGRVGEGWERAAGVCDLPRVSNACRRIGFDPRGCRIR